MVKNWDDGLEGPGLNIAKSTSDKLVVMAGPGTGKSFTLQRRILRLIQVDNVDPSKILALTFTRISAKDLKKDLHSLGIKDAESIKAMTLHAYCFSLLNQKSIFNTIKRIPRPIKSFNSKGSPQFEMSPLLADLELVGKFGDKREKAKKIKAFEAAWARRQDDIPNNVPVEDNSFKKALSYWLNKHKAMLLGELIPLVLEFLENNPTNEVFDSFSHIIVDEYQDLNKAEQVLIDTLGKNCKISVVGDVDQSIYSFKHAHPEGIKSFSNVHKDCEEFTLEGCRRCCKEIVSAANSLIINNHDSNLDRLTAIPNDQPGKVRIIQWKDDVQEASGITDFIKSLLNSNKYKPSDILILSPRRKLAYKLKDALLKNKLNVHSFFHEEAMEKKLAQKFVTLLNLIVHPDDHVSLRFWLGLGDKQDKCYAKQYKKLRDEAEKQNISIKDLLNKILANEYKIKRISQIIKAYQELLNYVDKLKEKSVNELVDILFPEEEDDTKILREACLIFLKEKSDASIKDLWEHIETIITHPDTPEHGNYISIMSLHKSKGLTSKVTIITSCIEGLMPNREDDTSTDEKIKEQRRLLYVAMTRAREYLVISSFSNINKTLAHNIKAKFYKSSSNMANTIASQFITEIKIKTITGEDWRNNNFS